jgi:flagellar biosynthesis protein
MAVKKKKESDRTKIAAAIRYDSAKDDAPRLTGKGKGHVADKIIELARKHNIPIRTDHALVHILSKLDMDQQIPPELYRAVAEILAFVYSANEQYREKQGEGVRVQVQETAKEK